MASIESYSSLITRAITTENDDPTLIYDITDKVKGGGQRGASEVTNVIRDWLVSSESHIRVRILDLIDILVVECGTDLHKALNQTGIFVTLADIHDKQVEAALPEHIAKWKEEMGPSYDVVFAQAFRQPASLETRGTASIQTDSTILTRRGIGGVGQFKVKLISPLHPFLTVAYFRALRILDAARNLHIFHMQIIHIARQALHLVILLNDSVDKVKGPTQEQAYERVNLEDELMDLETFIPKWEGAQFKSREDFISSIAEIKQQYEQFFKVRFYFDNARNPDQDSIYKKLLHYDQETFMLMQRQLGLFDEDDQLTPAWSFSALYPTTKIKYEEGGGQEILWDVVVKPDGTLTDVASGSEVSYLFWEAKTNSRSFTPSSSRPGSPSEITEMTPQKPQSIQPSPDSEKRPLNTAIVQRLNLQRRVHLHNQIGMELFMKNIPYSADQLQIVRSLQPILHGPFFAAYGGGAPFNFIVNLIKGRRHQHSGRAKLLLPTSEIASRLISYTNQYPLFLHNRKITLEPSRDSVQPDDLAFLSQPYQDPEVLEEEERRRVALGGSIEVGMVRFGYPCNGNEISIEWNSPRTENWSLEFSAETHQVIIKSSTTLRIVMALKSVSSATLDSNECVFWLERTPIFEQDKQDRVSQQNDDIDFLSNQFDITMMLSTRQNDPTRNRLTSPDPHQRRIFAFLRVICVSLEGYSSVSEFKRKASIVGLRTYAGNHRITTNIQRFSPQCLAHFDAWLTHIPFDIAFQVNALVSHTKFNPLELLQLRQEFSFAYDRFGAKDVCSCIRGLMQDRDDDPDATALDLFRKSLKNLEYRRTRGYHTSARRQPPEDIFQCHRVMVTPTSFVLSGPFPDETNRVVRKYKNYQSNFLRVEFREEDRLQIRLDREVDGEAFLDERVGAVLKEGLTIAGRRFIFLAYSSFALKEHAVWFIHPFTTHEGEAVTADSIREELGDFRNVIMCPARYGARLSQAFSTTEESVKIEPEEMIKIPDIVSSSGSMFTDGVGLVSPEISEEIWEIYTESRSKRSRRRLQTPSAYQIRLGGVKGMLCVDERLEGRVICIRPSMNKFESPDRMVEIARAFDRPMAMYLNRPLIMLLETLKVPVEPIMELQSLAVKQTVDASRSLESAARLLEQHGLGTAFRMTSILLQLHRIDPNLQSMRDPEQGVISFLKRLLKFAVNHVLRDLKYKARIPVPKPTAWTVVGVADEYSYLKENEIYAHVCDIDGYNKHIKGPVLISRSPTVHPGDARMVQAVGKLPDHAPTGLKNLTNCVVFNCKGQRSLPSMLGGDLDGDIYNLILDERLHPTIQFEPGAYTQPRLVTLSRPSTAQDIADFVVNYIKNDMLGAIAIQSLRTADLSPLCLADPDCLALAALHSDAVDFPKTGRPVESAQLPKTRLKLKPDWYANETNEKTTGFYESKRIIGQLFRAIKLPAVPEAQHVAKRQRRQIDTERDEDFQAEEVRRVFANDEHIISRLVYNRLRNYVSTEDLMEGDEDYIDEMLESSGQYAGDLAYLCRTHSLSTKTPVSEEEIVAGTILAKCSQARMRQDAISAMRRDSTALCDGVRQGIEGPEGTSNEDQILRAWTAWKVSIAFTEAFGTKSFGLLALDVMFSAMRAVDALDTASSRR